jgi:hypothetical protein
MSHGPAYDSYQALPLSAGASFTQLTGEGTARRCIFSLRCGSLIGVSALNLALDLARAEERRSNVRRAFVVGQKPKVGDRGGQGMALAA